MKKLINTNLQGLYQWGKDIYYIEYDISMKQFIRRDVDNKGIINPNIIYIGTYLPKYYKLLVLNQFPINIKLSDIYPELFI